MSTRKSASEAAVVLAKEFQKLLEAREPLPWPAPGRVDGRFKDKKLQGDKLDPIERESVTRLMHSLPMCIELASTGVSFHHAGLAQDDRRAVEQAFLQGKIRVLCEFLLRYTGTSVAFTDKLALGAGATTTLAIGVNLPR